MNAINYCILQTQQRIPAPILQTALRKHFQGLNQAPVTVSEFIHNAVIRSRMMLDMNLVGGERLTVQIDDLTPIYSDIYNIAYKIPKERTQYRDIISFEAVSHYPYLAGSGYNAFGQALYNPTQVSDIATAGFRVMDSLSNQPPISNAKLTMVGNNTVLIQNQYRTTQLYYLICRVGNDENLNNIHPASYIELANLCEHATKAFLYRTLVLEIDQGYLHLGQELGMFKTVLESYSESEMNYQTFLLETWSKVAFMNDTKNYDQFIRIQISGGL